MSSPRAHSAAPTAPAANQTKARKGAREEVRALLNRRERPLVPAGGAIQTEAWVDHAALHDRFRSLLETLRVRHARDPYANPVQLLALEIGRCLQRGDVTWSGLEQLIQRITVEAFAGRAERMGTWLGEVDTCAPEPALETLVRRIAEDGRLPFADFRARVEAEAFGIVMTAHPTFGLSQPLMRALADLGCNADGEGRPLTAQGRALLFELAADSEHRPDRGIDLATEHRIVTDVLANAQDALRRVYEVVFAVAAELYPDDWRRLTPRLITLATWVGYDMDGRSDILWSDTFTLRLREQALQLARYRRRLEHIVTLCTGPDGACNTLQRALDHLAGRLEEAAEEVEDEIAVLQSASARGVMDVERIRLMAKRMHEGRARRLTDTAPLVSVLDSALEAVESPELARDLCVLRAEISNMGLGMAHIHVRLNAMQLHNAVRKSIAMEVPPNAPTHRRSYVAALDRLLETVEPQTINFGNVLAERTSAKRLTMIIAQMVKYLDGTTPVRFLIAECETGATLLTALYFARLFGVDHIVDISPLFETADALEHGIVLLDEALGSPHYRTYLRRRGRLCIQTGFSDSGRYLGQTAAGHAIEQLRLRLADLLQRHGLEGLTVVVFNTHGESIGRGAHPANLASRLRYLAPPESRRRLMAAGVALKEEVSFQGGDGWIPFLSRPAALATLTGVLDYAVAPVDDAAGDPFYADADWVDEFFTAVRMFNARIMDDPNYAALLGAFGVNMLHPTGSRAVKREGASSGPAQLSHPSRMRAIPQNAILQQLGFLANTVGGFGQAISKDPEHFHALYTRSDRFRSLVGMVQYAMEFSDVGVLRAYVDSLDPGLWLHRAAKTSDPGRAALLREVSEHLDRIGVHDRLVRVLRDLQKEFMDVQRHLAFCGVEPGETAPRVVIDQDTRDDLQLLHALRIALIQHLYALAARVPRFSDQNGISHRRLVAQIMQLDVEGAVADLERIFPRVRPLTLTEDFGETATYKSDAALGYEREHEEIFQPLLRLHHMIRRTSSAIAHLVGAVG